MKTFEIKCSHERRRKDGRSIECRRFLAQINDYQILLVCPNCGRRYIITKGPMQKGFKIDRLPEEDAHLIKETIENG